MLLVALVGGCAEAASVVPGIRAEVGPIQRTVDRSGEGTQSLWGSWIAGGRATRPAEPPPESVDVVEEPMFAVTLGSSPPCRSEPVCAWEARARAEALERARQMLEEAR
jgi:hypothetical protein